MLPPLLATIGKGMVQKLSVAALRHTLTQARDVRAYLSRTGADEAPAEREARLRALYDTVLTRLDLDVPPEAIQPIIDHFVAMVLAEWDAEFVSASPKPSGAA